MALMETVYLSHGAPTLAIDETAPARQFFKSWQQSVYKEKPSSILVISAHWETEPTVNVVDRNDTIHDFHGFPKPLYQKGGGTIDLEPCLTHKSAVEPALAPVAVEQTMITCAAASNALWQQRFVRIVTIQCNLCKEPWIKYSISIVADKGLKRPLYTSERLKKGEVLYLETHSCRYELCFTGEKMGKVTQASQVHEETDKFHSHHPHSSNGEKHDCDNVLIDVFWWSRCKKPLPQMVMQSVGIPLPLEHVEVLRRILTGRICKDCWKRTRTC